MEKPRTSAHASVAPLAALAVMASVVAVTSITAHPARAAATHAASPSPATSGPAAALASMSEAERVGQLFMVGNRATRVDPAAVDAVRRLHVGSVILTGRSTSGTATTSSVVARLRAAATPAGTGLLVAVDQEGGAVQVLRGRGFAQIPSALTQGTRSPNSLRASAAGWGRQLAAAGVDIDLAPVLGTVPASLDTANAPIGRYGREFGHDPARVSSHGVAVQQGLQAGGVATTAKHFPGLGRVRGNTDTTRGVTDTTTTRHDAAIAPFRAAVDAGADLVMMSSATYSRIDPAHRAVFSHSIVTGMLRGDLGFRGVIISDSLNAVGVNDLPPAQRAVQFLQAGGDLVLADDARSVPAMVSGVLARTRTDASFARTVDAAALRVLILKQRRSLTGGSVAAASSTAGETVAQRGPRGSTRLFSSANFGLGWSGPLPLGGFSLDAPAVTTVPPNADQLVAVSGPRGAVYVRPVRGGRTAAGWVSLGGSGTSAPAVTATTTERLVAVRGPHSGIFVRSAGRTGPWRSWASLGGAAASAPVLASTPSGVMVAAVTGPDQHVYLRTRTNGRWSAHWVGIGGAAIGPPSIVVAPDTGAVTVLVRSTDSAIWAHHGTSPRGGWSGLGGVLADSPAAAAGAHGVLDVTATASDGRLWHRRRSSAGWSRWAAVPR